ncbi:MAG: trypsin-like peptidase domain-containing protein [Patescibacteria group bacterium]
MKLMLLISVLVIPVTAFSAEPKLTDRERSTVLLRRYVTNDVEMIKLHGTNALHVESTAWFHRSSTNLVTVLHGVKIMLIDSNWTELELFQTDSTGQSKTLQRNKARLVFSKKIGGDGIAVLELQHPFPGAYPLTISEKSPPREEPVQSIGYVVGRKLHLGKGELTYYEWGLRDGGLVPEAFGLELKNLDNTSAIDVGCSGAPIIDSHGNVIAVLKIAMVVTVGDDKIRSMFVDDIPCEGIPVDVLRRW